MVLDDLVAASILRCFSVLAFTYLAEKEIVTFLAPPGAEIEKLNGSFVRTGRDGSQLDCRHSDEIITRIIMLRWVT